MLIYAHMYVHGSVIKQKLHDKETEKSLEILKL